MLDRFASPFGRRPTEVNRGGSAAETETKPRLPVQFFELPLDIERSLNETQRRVRDTLRGSGLAIARLYLQQEAHGFRPYGSTQSELDAAFETAARVYRGFRPEHCYLERNEDGILEAIPVNIYWGQNPNYREIKDRLNMAASFASRGRDKDIPLATNLKALESAFKTGDFFTYLQKWVEVPEETDIEIFAAPGDAYDDPLIHSFEAWGGVIDRAWTQEAKKFTERAWKWARARSRQPIPKIDPRVENTFFIAGLAERQGWTANNQPAFSEIRAKSGSKFTISKPVFLEGLEESTDAYRKHVDPYRRKGVTDGLVRGAGMHLLIGHEIGHAMIPEDMYRRLGGYAVSVKELYCDLAALALIAQMEGLDRREREVAISLYMTNGGIEYQTYLENQTREPYYTASTSIFDTLRRNVLRINKQILSWESTADFFLETVRLWDKADNVVQYGRERDAREFYREHLKDLNAYKDLHVPAAKVPSFLRRTHKGISAGAQSENAKPPLSTGPNGLALSAG